MERVYVRERSGAKFAAHLKKTVGEIRRKMNEFCQVNNIDRENMKNLSQSERNAINIMWRSSKQYADLQVE